MPRIRSRPHLATLVLLTGLSVLSLNMFLPSLPAMTEEFGTRESVMGLAISGYMIVSAVLQLIMGPISDRAGRRPVMLGAMAAYCAASVGCLLAQDATVFLICRMAQGVVVTGAILSSAVIRDLWSAEEAAGKLGVVSAAMALAPMLGPMVGGVIDATLGWRAIFALYTLFGAIALGLVWVDLGETRNQSAGPPRLSAYLALLGSSRFWAFALCQTFAVGAFFIFLAGAPFVAVQVYGLSTAWVGVGLGSITGGFMLGSAMTARFAPVLGVHRMILAGRLAALAGLLTGAALFFMGLSHPALLFGATIFVGIGNGLTLPNASAGAMSVRPDLAGTAAGVFGAIMVAGGAVLTTLTVAVLSGSATPLTLLGLMLASVLLSLAAAVRARRVPA